MSIEEIVKKYGKNDYFDMNTGIIYHLSNMSYHLYGNVTKIPCTKDGEFIGNVEVKGDWTR